MVGGISRKERKGTRENEGQEVVTDSDRREEEIM
jgi:hypothetical protein